MQIREFGTAHREIVLLLHGGGLSWWNYREAAKLLKNEYHVIVPILDGHAGSDRPFTSIEENAAEIISWIDERCSGSVKMIGGLSLGAQILLEILSQRRDICAYALSESAAVIPSVLTNALIAPVFGSSYGLIQNRWFAKVQSRSLHIRPELFEDYYRDTCQINKTDMIALLKANTSYALKNSIRDASAEIHVYYGEKEPEVIRRSAEAIGRSSEFCTIHGLRGLHHGEFSMNYAEMYANVIRQMMGGR